MMMVHLTSCSWKWKGMWVDGTCRGCPASLENLLLLIGAILAPIAWRYSRVASSAAAKVLRMILPLASNNTSSDKTHDKTFICNVMTNHARNNMATTIMENGQP